MVAIWPYESLEQRAEIRRAAEAGPNPIWPPDTSDLIVSMVSEIFLPTPFMIPLGERDIGALYEMRIYTYPAEGMPQVLEAWGASIPEREKFSPLAGCWYSKFGGLNNFIHLWAYKSFDERLRIRAETREQGVWPPKGSVRANYTREQDPASRTFLADAVENSGLRIRNVAHLKRKCKARK